MCNSKWRSSSLVIHILLSLYKVSFWYLTAHLLSVATFNLHMMCYLLVVIRLACSMAYCCLWQNNNKDHNFWPQRSSGAAMYVTWHDITWCDVTCHDVVWHGIAWHVMMWCDMMWHVMTWPEFEGENRKASSLPVIFSE